MFWIEPVKFDFIVGAKKVVCRISIKDRVMKTWTYTPSEQRQVILEPTKCSHSAYVGRSSWIFGFTFAPKHSDHEGKPSHWPTDESSVLLSSLHQLDLWAQALSTSEMVLGVSEDRIRGPPSSLITTSSSILTPSPRNLSGTWSSSSQMYSPGRHGGIDGQNSVQMH